MKKIKIAIIREGKVPHDKRVALSPQQCVHLQKIYPQVAFVVQPCEYRCIAEMEYLAAGINVSDKISDADILLGIKEVPKEQLIAEKKYLFFSHTIKQQPHNKSLLQNILNKKIQLIDYECLVDDAGNRIIGFGRYAGIAGAYNTIRAYGLKYKKFRIKAAQDCEHKADLEKELRKSKFDKIKIVLTGSGRVANGAIEIMGALKIRKVTPYEILMFNFSEPVYAQIHSDDYYVHKDGLPWNKQHFYQHPAEYISSFKKFSDRCDILIHCAFWDPAAPKLFSLDEMSKSDFKIKIIGDITCDINGSIPSTTQSTTIERPFFDYDPYSRNIMEGINEKYITTMAVDNLPCSLPRDASETFGQELIEKVLPFLINNPENLLIERASITKNGKLQERFGYLSDYVKS